MDRTQAPGLKAADHLDLVFPEEIVLENGISLFWLKNVSDDSVRLDIEWFAGTKYQNKNLVAGFTNRLLLSGNYKKSARQISEEIDFYGGFVQEETDKDHASVSLYGLRENFTNIFQIFSEAMLSCEFPEKEFNEERSQALSRFKIDSQKVKYLCQRKFNGSLFGAGHPYGKTAIEADFNALDREDILAFYRQFYLGTKPVLFLTGMIDDAGLDKIRKWSGHLGSEWPQLPAGKFVQEKGRIKVEKKDAIQTAIRIGRLAVNKKHPDYFALQVLDTILGGYFGSRLMANIREEKGYTYGIGSAIAVLEESAYFFISTEVASGVVEDTVKEIYHEFERLKTELVPSDELERVKNYMLGEFLRQSDGPSAMMDCFKNIWFNHLSREYYNDFIQAIHALVPEDLQRVARTYLIKEDMTEVIAG